MELTISYNAKEKNVSFKSSGFHFSYSTTAIKQMDVLYDYIISNINDISLVAAESLNSFENDYAKQLKIDIDKEIIKIKSSLNEF